jgi:2-iminobutanoate/2-iminopropanoate deaminase
VTVDTARPRVFWAGNVGFCYGLLATDIEDGAKPLPESVEAQTRKIVHNLERVLDAHGLTSEAVTAIHIHLTQFRRFHERMHGAFIHAFARHGECAVSCVGVTDLPRDALVQMNITIIQ